MRKNTDPPSDLIYTERLSSNRTEALFLALALVFLMLVISRVNTGGWGGLAVAFLFFFAVFAFYSLNYRTMVIVLTSKVLRLKFGTFSWTVPLDNIQECRTDEIPVIKRLGGAGIHLMYVRGRYRASFNFLEHPRAVVVFKKKVGPVQEISFSTGEPDEVVRLIEKAVSEGGPGRQVSEGN
jgi:energy-coupling factor transporter transmembrane protein EcfT